METAELPPNQTTKTKEAPIKITSNDLCEFLFGLPLTKENLPQILRRLEEDNQIIRRKYDLPPIQMLKDNPREYQRRLEEKAKAIGVTILPKSMCGSFFEEAPMAGAAFISHLESGSLDDKIGVDIKEETLNDLIRSIINLEHELIHALQAKRYPSMPIEIQEYEAYVSNINLKYLRENPDAIEDVFFDFFLGGSVRTWYKIMNEEASKRGLPTIIPPYKQ
jgi:hypothetical protein